MIASLCLKVDESRPWKQQTFKICNVFPLAVEVLLHKETLPRYQKTDVETGTRTKDGNRCRHRDRNRERW